MHIDNVTIYSAELQQFYLFLFRLTDMRMQIRVQSIQKTNSGARGADLVFIAWNVEYVRNDFLSRTPTYLKYGGTPNKTASGHILHNQL